MDVQERKDVCKSTPSSSICKVNNNIDIHECKRMTIHDIVHLITLESKIQPFPYLSDGHYKELKHNRVYVNRIFSELVIFSSVE